MLNKDSHFIKDIFAKEIPEEPTRAGYGRGLLEAGEKDKNIVALCADLTESTNTHLFAKKFPNRFVQVGITEQSMASVASGMAAMGKIPFFSSYAMFSPGRNWEQIRTTICYNEVNAKIVGSHSGVSVGPDGATHQALEDIAITRVIPNMTVLVPSDSEAARKATIKAAEHDGPVYIRLAREKTPLVTTEKTPFEIGEAYPVWICEQPEVTFFSCGDILFNVLKVAKTLTEKGKKVSVVNVPTIKPLDVKTIIDFTKRSEKIVTVEEHQKIGGLGSAICEVLSEFCPRQVLRLGVDDLFGESGTPKDLFQKHKIDYEGILSSVEKYLK